MSTVQATPIPDISTTFAASRTHALLRTACLGEIHARRLYLQAAHTMEENHLYVIAHAFRFTAAQEKEHADIFRGLIAAHGGSFVPMTEETPLLLPRKPLEILQAVAHAEHDEWDHLYPHNAQIASEEGYPRIAAAFRRIAETEQSHAQRFLQYGKALAEGRLFRAKHSVSWLCLPCGQLHTGKEAPELCSSCGRDRGHFIRSNYYPFVIED